MKILKRWILNAYLALRINEWKNPFRWVTIERKLLKPASSEYKHFTEETEVPDSYKLTSTFGNIIYKYWVVKNVSRRAILMNCSFFNNINYTVYTNLKFLNAKPIQFDTNITLCIPEQIELQLAAAYDNYF